ncbi:MAG: hypothetical protein ACM3TR_06470 [Caulobacteraceae bacterium]
MSEKRLLLLNGSSRKKGTSYSFARTMKTLTENMGNGAEITHVIDYFDGREEFSRLKELIAQSDIVAMIAPLYADTLPYFDIRLLERLADESGGGLKGKGFFAVGQCGFPDITRIEPLLSSCRLFAGETGMEWLGGLAYGGGGIINGKLIEDLGKSGEKITSGFKLALGEVFQGKKIPSEAQELITVRIPRILHRPLAAYLNSNARKLARENGNVDFAKKIYLE